MDAVSILVELVTIAVDVFAVLFLLRLLLPERDFYFNPTLGRIRQVTDPVILPIRRLPVRVFYRDLSPLVAVAVLVVLRGLFFFAVGAGPTVGAAVVASILRMVDFVTQGLLVVWIVWALIPPQYNPIARLITAAAAPLVAGERRLPGLPRAALLAVFILGLAAGHLAATLGGLWLLADGYTPAAALPVAGGMTLALFLSTLKFFLIVLLVGVLMTWFSPDPRNPLVQVVGAVTNALLRPFRWLPLQFGGIDFSPVVALLAYSFALQWLTRLLS